MRFSPVLTLVTVATLLSALVVTAQEKSEKLDTVRFPTSCPPAAQAEFEPAVALLH